ncbi:MAG: prenyltransferase [Acidobacteria bacterium]|nr:prenyltransferase [Acidobacteriota bacterium]
MSELLHILKISRPRFWIYIFGPYLVGLAAAVKIPEDLINPNVFIWGIYFTLPANLLIYGINDIFDFETDRLNPKKQSFESLVDPSFHKRLYFYIFLLNLPFLMFLIFGVSQIAGAAMIGFLFFSIFYSAPPIRAKTKPLLDSAFNILYVFPGIFSFSLLAFDFPPLLVVIAAGFWTMAMHAYSAIPDIDSDRQANISTIATWLGPLGTHIFCIACYLAASFISFLYIGRTAIVFGIAYIVMMAASMILRKSERVFEVYRKFPALNTIIGFSLFWIIAYTKFFR